MAAAKKATAKKTTAKKTTAKKRTAKKATAKKATAKKATAKKTTAKKATAKKKTAKKANAKKATAKKTTAKKKTPASRRSKPLKEIAPDSIENEIPQESWSNRQVAGLTHVEYEDACKRLLENSAEISRQRMVVQQIFDEYHDELFDHPDVCGLHVGLKRSEGKVCHPLKYCIRLHVRKKWAKDTRCWETPINLDRFKEFEVELDVIERSYRNIAAMSPPYIGAMAGGRPISVDGLPDHWGTMGIIVFTLDGHPRYLTNKHVAGAPGTLIRESDQGVMFSGSTDILGEVDVSLRNTRVDCAIITPREGKRKCSGVLKPDEESGLLPGNYAIRRLTSVDEHETEVFKIGASTGFEPVRVGVVKNVNTSIEINGLKMTGQIIVESKDNSRIIQGGDSGSIAIVRGGDSDDPVNFIVGLVHAETVSADNSRTGQAMVANHFDEVQSALRIKLFRG